MSELLRVDFERLRSDIEALSHIGRVEGDHGLFRRAFSPAWNEACEWLGERLRTAGLEARRDEALNVIGSLPTGEGPSVVTGSHLDSVPGGGHLDGALGVVVGLECLRRMRELSVDLARPVELIAFNDEEGRFGGMFGSQALAGHLTPEHVWGAEDADGVRLQDVLQEAGVEPLHALRAQRPASSVHRFVELHIEQGPVLDATGVNVGAVTGIVGLRRWQARFLGQANHAGTTPMNMRQDAFQGLAELSLGIPALIREQGGEHGVITIGRVELSPGAANVIPGQADFTVDIRDVEGVHIERLAHAFREQASRIARERGLRFHFEPVSEIEPVTCDPEVVAVVEQVAGDLGETSRRLPSGAAHDTQIMASLAPVGMVFVPSRGGRSHSAAEWTSWEAIQAGADTLLNVLYRLAK